MHRIFRAVQRSRLLLIHSSHGARFGKRFLQTEQVHTTNSNTGTGSGGSGAGSGSGAGGSYDNKYYRSGGYQNRWSKPAAPTSSGTRNSMVVLALATTVTATVTAGMTHKAHAEGGSGGSGGGESKTVSSVPGGSAVTSRRNSRAGLPPLLSHADILARISAHAETQELTPEQSRAAGGVSRIQTATYNANPIPEDTFAINTASLARGGSAFGVFDGHSGTAASYFCRDELLPYLNYYHSRAAPESGFINPRAFIAADSDFLSLALLERRFQDGLSGACVIVSHLSPDGSTITTGNAGDCRSIVGRRVPAAGSSGDAAPDSYVAIPLSDDHQIDTNPAERERLIREHPNEPDIIHHNRVKGRLQPTRGLGDGLYKRIEFFTHHKISASNRYAVWNPPYTLAEPTITRHTVTGDDRFVVLSSDGLFQDLSSQAVVDYMSEFLQSPAARASVNGNASTWLIKKALLHASEYQFGALSGGETANLSAILQVPLSHRRRVHDDLTVVVVFLNQNTTDTAAAATTTATATVPVPPTLTKVHPNGLPLVTSKL